MPADLTDAQARGLAAWIAYQREHGRPPTQRELCEALGFSAVNAARDLLGVLERKGYLIVEPKIARGSALTDKGRTWMEEGRCCS